MSRLPRLQLALALALASGLVAGPEASQAAADGEEPRIYRWIDADGVVHYTTDPERVPTALRARIPAAPSQAPEAGSDAPALGTGTPEAWIERDRPPEASELEVLGGDDFGVDDSVRSARLDEISARIETLRESIAADEETLKQRVVGPDADPMASGDDEEMRAVAARLPTLLNELQALRDERTSLEAR